MYTLKMERVVNAPADIVWDVISDVERYAEYAPNLSRAHKISQDSMARRCYDNRGRGWNEACVLWEEGKVYSYVIDTSDYPYPFVQMKGTWGLEPQEQGVKIYMRFDYTPKYPSILGWIVHRGIRRASFPIIVALMDNWEKEIMQRVAQRAAA